ncbi:MAG: hypothetical protein EHM14_08565 [Methanothrix sp.]|nr:MAG: hypothetical protein EHM14_08565 [Methanothrix sp.]
MDKSDPLNFQEILDAKRLEEVSRDVVWQNFERLTAFIFEENGFQVLINTVKTSCKRRRQYDVIARKSHKTFLVECKKWSGNRYRLSALKAAIEKHIERTLFYENVTNEDATPIIVTLIEEEIQFYEGIPVIPILKLNSFLNEIDKTGFY